jgi:hypothetical protein
VGIRIQDVGLAGLNTYPEAGLGGLRRSAHEWNNQQRAKPAPTAIGCGLRPDSTLKAESRKEGEAAESFANVR